MFGFLVYWFRKLKFKIYLFLWGVYSSKYESQINQRVVLFRYLYWLFACRVISDILIECIGFLENFAKLLEKSFGTTYFINKIEKTLLLASNFADNSTRLLKTSIRSLHKTYNVEKYGALQKLQFTFQDWFAVNWFLK